MLKLKYLNKIMKTTTIAVIAGLITFISLYAAVSFAYMDLNCLHWNGVARGMILFFSILSFIFVGCGVTED